MRHVAVVGRDHQLPLFARERPYRGGIGVDQRFEKFAQHGLGRALLARDRQQWIGTASKPARP